jgi:hypothetical protein
VIRKIDRIRNLNLLITINLFVAEWLLVTAVGLRSVGFGATHFSLDKSRMGGDTFQPKNPTFLKPTVSTSVAKCY